LRKDVEVSREGWWAADFSVHLLGGSSFSSKKIVLGRISSLLIKISCKNKLLHHYATSGLGRTFCNDYRSHMHLFVARVNKKMKGLEKQ
jgi:hypothetical protein